MNIKARLDRLEGKRRTQIPPLVIICRFEAGLSTEQQEKVNETESAGGLVKIIRIKAGSRFIYSSPCNASLDRTNPRTI